MSKTAKRDSTISFGLSFLDVLCCGLGAAILLLLVVKHGPTASAQDEDGFLLAQVTQIQDELAAQTVEKENLLVQIEKLDEQIARELAQRDSQRAANVSQTKEYLTLLTQLKQAREALRTAKSELFEAQAKRSRIEDTKVSQTQDSYLTGLMIKRSKVVVMLDSSASMLAQSIVDIVRLRVSRDAIKQNAEKWVSAKATALWVHEKIGENNEFAFVSFSDKVTDEKRRQLSKSTPLKWRKKLGQPASTTTDFTSNVNQLVPHGGTDLERAFAVVATLQPKPQQIVLITDGLPTIPGERALGLVGKCPIARKGTTPIISAACRSNIFERARRFANSKLRGIPIDIVLLPLDGDSDAIGAYWKLAAERDGRLLSPAKGWPNS